MTAFIASFLFVLLAEMADKTQLIAMAFAVKYRASQVLIAIFIATLINNSLAVFIGRILTTIIPIDIISSIAALSFIVFGLWTIRGDKLEDENKKVSRFGPIATIGIAFFLAEMGDKTQLATISLAIKYQNIFGVLMGTTLAMVTADAIGIVLGIAMRKHIPQETIKWVSAIIFILFGLYSIYNILQGKIGHTYVWAILVCLAGCTIYALNLILRSKGKS